MKLNADVQKKTQVNPKKTEKLVKKVRWTVKSVRRKQLSDRLIAGGCSSCGGK